MNSLLQQANCGDSHAQFKIAEAAYHGGDYETAHGWFLKAAQAGQIQAQTNIGVLYMEGEGCELDLEEAKRWLLQAAERGESNAMLYLACLLVTNPKSRGETTTPQAQKDGARWMRIAAQQEMPDAVTRLGYLYWHGLGVEKDAAKALKYYEKGVRMGGNPDAVSFGGGEFSVDLKDGTTLLLSKTDPEFAALKARLLSEIGSS
jgi:TPR repeat protein